MKSLEWMKQVPVMLLERFYAKCESRKISYWQGIIEAVTDWLNKE